MIKFIIACAVFLVALCAGSPASAHGHFFIHKTESPGVESPHQLADLIRISLAADPSGHKALTPDRCSETKLDSCATPQDYLDGFKYSDPQGVPATLAELAAYVDTFVLLQPEVGQEYFSACLYIRPAGHSIGPNCVSRTFNPGEKAWGNPKTRKITLAQDCGNPVGMINPIPEVKVNPACVTVKFPGGKGDEIAIFVYGVEPLPVKECTALKQAGSADFHSGMPHDCPDICKGWEGIYAIQNLLGDKHVVVLDSPQPSFIQQVDGVNELRLPRDILDGKHEVRICRHGPNGEIYMSVGVRDIHFQNSIAVVKESDWHRANEAPKELTSQEAAAMDAASRH